MSNLSLSNRDVLYDVAEAVDTDENVEGLIDDMWDIMEGKGIGLAAPQVGASKQVIIIDTGSFRQTIINPVITKIRTGISTGEEGCLSYPGVYKKIKRHKRITVEGFDRNWNPIKHKLHGLEARVVQHEIDHLFGKTITRKGGVP